MAELSALRARLKDRQVKEGALGSTEVSICLDVSLLSELADLESTRRTFVANRPASESLAGSPVDAATPYDDEIEAKKQEIREASLLIVFRALSSVKYQEIVNGFEDPDEEERVPFLRALVAASFREVWNDGEKVDLGWDEIAPEIGFGEFDDIATKVFVLNKRRQDVPFSLRPSKATLS